MSATYHVFESPVLWAQVDANHHLRHSAYADFAAQARIAALDEVGLKMRLLTERQLGPILFREELLYHREVGMNDTVRVHTYLTKAPDGGSRFTICHELYRGDGVKAATITIEGAWINTEKRRLARLPEDLSEQFMQLPRAEGFEE